MAIVTRSDAGSGSTVCTAPPPPPGSQVGRCGVVVQAADQLEGAAAVGAAPQRVRLAAGPDDVRPVGRVGAQLPHAGQRGPGVLGEADRAVVALVPGRPEVVGPHDRRAPVAVLDAGEHPRLGAAGVDGDRGDLLGEQVRAVHGPGAAVVVTAGEPQPLARSDGQQVGHGAPPEVDGSTWGDRRAGEPTGSTVSAAPAGAGAAPTGGETAGAPELSGGVAPPPGWSGYARLVGCGPAGPGVLRDRLVGRRSGPVGAVRRRSGRGQLLRLGPELLGRRPLLVRPGDALAGLPLGDGGRSSASAFSRRARAACSSASACSWSARAARTCASCRCSRACSRFFAPVPRRSACPSPAPAARAPPRRRRRSAR